MTAAAVPAAAPFVRPRLTAPVLRRRRRAAVAVLVAGLAALAVLSAAAGAWLAGPAAGAAGPVPAEARVTVVATRGDTLWHLLRPHVPAGVDRGAYVAAVAEANGLEDPRTLRPGTVVHVPGP